MPRIPFSLIDVEHKRPIGPGAIVRSATSMIRDSAVPIVVESHGAGRYRLLRGLRRYLVAQAAGEKEIDAIIKGSRS